MRGKIRTLVILGAVLLLRSPLTAGEPRVTDGLIIYYSFDDPDFYTNGQVVDDSGNGHNATVKGDVFYDNTVPKRGSGCAQFMGFASQSYPPYPSHLDMGGNIFPPEDMPTSALTVSIWVRCDPYADTDPAGGSKHEHCFLNIIPDNWEAMIHGERRYSIFRFLLGYGPAASDEICDFRFEEGYPSGIELNSWYWLHLTGVYDRTAEQAIIYYNGKPWWVMTPEDEPALVPENLAADWSGGAFLGAHVYAHPLWNRTFHGYMDEFYMFDRALSEKEIQILAATQETVGDYIETDGSTFIIEPVHTLYRDTFDIVLNSQPASNVTVTPINGGSADLKFIGSSIKTFTNANWYVPQTITIEAKHDTLKEDKVETKYISFSVSSSDSNFNGKFIPDVRVSILDNDQPIVWVDPVDGVTVSESGTTDTYEVFLLYPPAAGQTVTVTPSDNADPCHVIITPTSRAFNSSNYTDPQSFTVRAFDDEVLNSPNPSYSTTISHFVTSGDSGYNGLETDSVLAVIIDNECGAWGYDPADFDKNCTVDLMDFALLSADFLNCTVPNLAGCHQK